MAFENIRTGGSRDLAERIAARIADANAEDQQAQAAPTWTREDMAIEAYVAEAAATMRAPSRAQRIQERVSGEEEQVAKQAHKERVKAWYSELSDEALDRFADKIREEQSRRAPVVDDDELTDPENTAEYGGGSVDDSTDAWTDAWFTEHDDDSEVDDDEVAE